MIFLTCAPSVVSCCCLYRRSKIYFSILSSGNFCSAWHLANSSTRLYIFVIFSVITNIVFSYIIFPPVLPLYQIWYNIYPLHIIPYYIFLCYFLGVYCLKIWQYFVVILKLLLQCRLYSQYSILISIFFYSFIVQNSFWPISVNTCSRKYNTLWLLPLYILRNILIFSYCCLRNIL